MKQPHIWPSLVLTILGFYLVLAFGYGITLFFGFIFVVLGVGITVYHLTVDEHIKI